ncbi:uncharacterized protein CIMG_12893 [Coccidioides immitis RS]|uniref:Uncharacterized protein n=1 Tax=Coccidioides immitis (strain RS) TaxID=246410 RepID=A0A0D8JSL9_COCIM|nr:uncharacterized protein CIMG_12893 [Coccidioides immitis RS]KJF60345.1 hypothetical protein CIMG_12893 [Coccidioides immitis RS]
MHQEQPKILVQMWAKDTKQNHNNCKRQKTEQTKKYNIDPVWSAEDVYLSHPEERSGAGNGGGGKEMVCCNNPRPSTGAKGGRKSKKHKPRCSGSKMEAQSKFRQNFYAKNTSNFFGNKISLLLSYCKSLLLEFFPDVDPWNSQTFTEPCIKVPKIRYK